mmetsp:Transcript_1747/g.4459  ORF Transcript_1747/g.4459 Transcript_1747/m.4459 type:complete len:202 (+) Transcript_1747:84-689(+)
MGKYAKKTVVPKSSVKNGPKAKSSKKRKPTQKTAKQKAARRRQQGAAKAANQTEAHAEAAMSDSADAGIAPTSAAEKVIGFLSRSKTEAKLMDAVKKLTRTHKDADSLGAALLHCAGRGHAAAVEWLIAAAAPLNWCDPRTDAGPRTPLQLAASRGHVNACSMLTAAGADRSGALDATKLLTQYGAVFQDERKAIEAILSR